MVKCGWRCSRALRKIPLPPIQPKATPPISCSDKRERRRVDRFSLLNGPHLVFFDFVVVPEVCAQERSGFPSRAGASGSHHIPWALPRVLQAIPKIKRVGGSDWPAGRVHGVVCSRGASSDFIPGRHASATAARVAERRRENGRAGKPKTDTGRRRRANRNGTVKASATGSVSKAGNHQNQKQLTRLRG